MTAELAIGSDHITEIGVGIIVALVVIGALLSFIITALIGRIIVLVAVVVLAIVVWQQRGRVKDSYNTQKCDLHATFFGVQLDAPNDVKQACQRTR